MSIPCCLRWCVLRAAARRRATSRHDEEDGRDASRARYQPGKMPAGQCAREADESICYNPPLSYVRLAAASSQYKQ